MQQLKSKLHTLGYTQVLTYDSDKNILSAEAKTLFFDDIFFVDAGYKVDRAYLFVISSPLHEIKGQLVLTQKFFEKLMQSAYAPKFNIEIQKPSEDIIIKRQYGMRKIPKYEFDSKRYTLKIGFPDFPTCPYGNSFKMLGYDVEKNEYVRLASTILKDPTLSKITYQGEL